MREAFLSHFPNAGDVVFIAGKTTRVVSFMLVLLGIIFVRKLMTTWFMSSEGRQEFRKHGDAYSVSQAFVFFGTAIALHAPYSKIPYASWELGIAVVVCLIVQLLTLVLLRVAASSTHKAMMGGNMGAGIAMGLYAVAAGIGTNAVLNAAL